MNKYVRMVDRIARAEEIQRYTENRCRALEKENTLLKSTLYCTTQNCDNCGFVKCENFQRQRKNEPCSVYVSYKDRITKQNLQLNEAKEIIQNLIADKPDTYSGTNIELLQKKMFSFQKAVNEAEQFLKEIE